MTGNEGEYQDVWEKHSLETLHVYERLIKNYSFPRSRTGNCFSSMGPLEVFESVIRLVPKTNSMSGRHCLLSGDSEYECEAWCVAIHWCVDIAVPILEDICQTEDHFSNRAIVASQVLLRSVSVGRLACLPTLPRKHLFCLGEASPSHSQLR